MSIWGECGGRQVDGVVILFVTVERDEENRGHVNQQLNPLRRAELCSSLQHVTPRGKRHMQGVPARCFCAAERQP